MIAMPTLVLAVVVLVARPGRGSTLTSSHPAHPHLPHIRAGPYQPWAGGRGWDTRLMEEHRPAPPPSHQQQQGYQTNIIIDQHAKVGNK